MPKRSPRTEARSGKDGVLSGAVGGPSTGLGTSYQTDYALLLALEMIEEGLSVPDKPLIIRMEPRALAPDNLTRWDLAVEPPETLIEAKLNPKRQEILDWLDRVRQGGKSAPTRNFCLVYSEGGGTLRVSLEHLLRIAVEAKGDTQKLKVLIDLEDVKHADEILARLGSDCYELLPRIRLEHIPKDILERDIRGWARRLAGETGAGRLTDLLFRKLSKAATSRSAFLIQDLINDIESKKIRLHSHPDVETMYRSTEVAAALFVIRACPTGIPLEVVAQAISSPSADLELKLLPVVNDNALMVDGGLWFARPLPRRPTRSDAADLLSRSLEALLGFIERHKQDAVGWTQIRNAVALTKECAGPRPESVARVFMTLDKLLKRLGDKHLVLEMADISIRAARRSNRTRGIVEGEAQALICGRSWVFQRVGRLSEARAYAEKSLDLGESIGWDRNTAFCKKCIGRLLRIEAEATQEEPQKRSLLSDSIAQLQDAIERFSRMADFGPNHDEVGDCYSLLGRTYLVDRQWEEAANAIRIANKLIPAECSKEYLDLLILRGDLEAVRGNRQAARALYDDALHLGQDSDSETTEMLARAYLQRGLNHRALGAKELATQDFKRAAETWTALGERPSAARAQWEEVRVDKALSQKFLDRLEREPFMVRVTAVAFHKNRLAASTGRRIPRREEPGPAYWEQIIQQAKEHVAVEVVEW